MSQAAQGAKFEVRPRFAVPLVRAEHPQPERLNPSLRELFLLREAEGDRYRNVDPTMNIRPGLFESRFDLFEWPESPIVELRAFCFSALFKAVAELSGYSRADIERLEVRANAWFHITRRGGYFGQHNHPMASWSGVYSVDAGQDRSSHPESGALVFSHPAAVASSFVDLGCVNLKDPWGIRPASFHLKPGELVLFPSWLMHQVMPFQGDGERITVAFNAWFRQKAAGSGGSAE